MSEHNRRPHCWEYYHLAHSGEIAFLIEMIATLIRESPCPRGERSNRGRPLIHSKDKLDFVCILMIMYIDSYRDAESRLHVTRIPWDEPVPDHTTIARHLQTIPEDWLQEIPGKTARLCMKEAAWTVGSVGADSSAVETTRYETVTRPDKKARDFGETSRKLYLKYHIVAILGLQIILESEITSSNVSDSPMLPSMLDGIQQQSLDLGQSVLNADRGYDSDDNCGKAFDMGMIPNIKQRKDAVSRGKPNRRKAAGIFDEQEYKKRSLIEGIFGAEETKRHQLHCRFLIESNQRRFGKIRTIAWNLKVLNRLRCANKLGIPIPAYAA